jgi:hypothetical protein
MLRETGKILGDLETGQEVNEVLLKSSLALATSLFGRNFSFNPTSHNPALDISEIRSICYFSQTRSGSVTIPSKFRSRIASTM